MMQHFTDYQPNAAVLGSLQQVSFVGVIGPTAAGKSTVVKRARELDPSIHIVLSTVSRPPRPGEVDNVDYHFRSREEMLARIEQREFVQVPPSLLGDIYATAPEDYSSHGTSVLALLADVVPVFRKLPFKDSRMVFVLPPDYETWQARIERHHFTPQQLQKRLAEAAHSLRFACADPDVLFILNDDLDVAAEEFVAIVHGRLPSFEQQQACRDLAKLLYSRLQASLPEKEARQSEQTLV